MAKRKHRRHRRRARVIRRRFRRNPIEGGGFIANTVTPAAIGAAGAVAVDFLQGLIPLPASLTQSTLMQPLVSIGYSLLVGMAGDAAAGPKVGGELAAGGIVVALYNLFNGLIGSGQQGMGSQYQQQMNRYMGFLRRNPRVLAAINQRRAMNGLAPVNMHPKILSGLGNKPVGIRPLRRGLAATSPYAYTKQRVGRGALGYVGPARTLGRYMSRR